MHLPIACHFVTQTPWSTFRVDSPVTTDRKVSAAIKYISVPPRFSKSANLLLLQALKETVQCVATVKCALDLSAYKDIKRGNRIKMNCIVSFGDEISNGFKNSEIHVLAMLC